MKLTIIGTGYVGLVTGTCFADSGNDVICMDIDKKKIDALKKGVVPIYEPGLKELIQKNYKEGRLHFTTDMKDAVRKSGIIFIAVGTPPDNKGATDLSAIKAVAKEIGSSMNGHKIIVTKSTVPVGSADVIKKIIAKETIHQFDIASNPEFLKEGAAIDDFMKPDRVVVGVENEDTGEVLKSLYEPFTRTGNPIILTDIRSSEMIKYAANAMLATKISFINEIANLCTMSGANIDDVRKGIGYDNRIGHLFLFPGVGYGGSCFPKDVKSVIHVGKQYGYAMNLLTAVDRVNDRQKALMPAVIKRHFNGKLKGRRFALWGLAFKPKTDDIREAPSLVIIDALIKAGAHIVAHDPEAVKNVKALLGKKIQYANDMYAALKGADGLVLVTEWNEYRKPNFDRMSKLMKGRVVFDGRNIFDKQQLSDAGFAYYGIGR